MAHLAAQAGVRYSLKNPLAYIHENVQCFTTLLETVKDYDNIKVVYASSSSVYGRNTKGIYIYICSAHTCMYSLFVYVNVNM